MADNYQKLYMNKKENLIAKVPITDELEHNRARSSSPKPRASVSVPCNNKVAYKSDLDDIKKSIESLTIFIKDDVALIKNNITVIESSLKPLTNDNLKTVVNDAVKGFNENLKKVASEMIGQIDKINELKSRVETIENVL